MLQCENQNNPLFAFQAPGAENKQRFLERDMLNTLPVGYSGAKQLCEISCWVFKNAENDFLTILKTKSEPVKPKWDQVHDRRISWKQRLEHREGNGHVR